MIRSMFLTTVTVAFVGLQLGCRCSGPAPTEDGGGAIVDASAGAPADGSAAPAEGDTPGPSADVQALIDAGDAATIAADLERRVTELQSLAQATGERARTLEVTAESMTGRKEPVDPADPTHVDTLLGSADALAKGADELLTDVERAEQLVRDVRAESDALYGRPAVPTTTAAAPATPSPPAPSPASPAATP